MPAVVIAVGALALVALTACGGKGRPSATSGSSSTTTSAAGPSTSSTPTTTGATGTTATTTRPADRTDCAVAQGGEVTIVAKDLAWTVPCLQAPEGVRLTVVIKNEDSGVNHDLRITGLPGKPGSPLTAGPSTQRLALGATLRAGSYAYVCDIHPNMTGTLDVLSPLPEGTVTTAQ